MIPGSDVAVIFKIERIEVENQEDERAADKFKKK